MDISRFCGMNYVLLSYKYVPLTIKNTEKAKHIYIYNSKKYTSEFVLWFDH